MRHCSEMKEEKPCSIRCDGSVTGKNEEEMNRFYAQNHLKSSRNIRNERIFSKQAENLLKSELLEISIESEF